MFMACFVITRKILRRWFAFIRTRVMRKVAKMLKTEALRVIGRPTLKTAPQAIERSPR
jgi:hypothetical protein